MINHRAYEHPQLKSRQSLQHLVYQPVSGIHPCPPSYSHPDPIWEHKKRIYITTLTLSNTIVCSKAEKYSIISIKILHPILKSASYKCLGKTAGSK